MLNRRMLIVRVNVRRIGLRVHHATRELLAEGRDNVPGFNDNVALGRQQVAAALDQLSLQSQHAAAYRLEGLGQRAENRLLEVPRTEGLLLFVLERKVTGPMFLMRFGFARWNTKRTCVTSKRVGRVDILFFSFFSVSPFAVHFLSRLNRISAHYRA